MDSDDNCFCQFPIAKKTCRLQQNHHQTASGHPCSYMERSPPSYIRAIQGGAMPGAVPADFLVLFHLLYFEPMKCIICWWIIMVYLCFLYINLFFNGFSSQCQTFCIDHQKCHPQDLSRLRSSCRTPAEPALQATWADLNSSLKAQQA
jgi:hypothetical protein